MSGLRQLCAGVMRTGTPTIAFSLRDGYLHLLDRPNSLTYHFRQPTVLTVDIISLLTIILNNNTNNNKGILKNNNYKC